MVVLIHEKYATYYHANKMSFTFLFCFIIYVLIIVVPFLIGFTSNGIYPPLSISNYSQIFGSERVSTTNSLRLFHWINTFLLFKLQRIASSILTYLKYSRKDKTQINYHRLQFICYQQMTQMSSNAQSQELAKTQNFTVDVKLYQKSKTIQYVQMLLFYEYSLLGNVKLKMQSYAEISLSSTNGISRGLVVGDINFRQVHPIQSGAVERVRYNYPSYYDEDGALLQDQIQIIEADRNRNESLTFNYNKMVQPALANEVALVNIILKVPNNEEIIYIATLLETFKFAWVQYFAIFLIFYAFGSKLLNFVIENNVYPTYKIHDIPQQAPSYSKKKMH